MIFQNNLQVSAANLLGTESLRSNHKPPSPWQRSLGHLQRPPPDEGGHPLGVPSTQQCNWDCTQPRPENCYCNAGPTSMTLMPYLKQFGIENGSAPKGLDVLRCINPPCHDKMGPAVTVTKKPLCRRPCIGSFKKQSRQIHFANFVLTRAELVFSSHSRLSAAGASRGFFTGVDASHASLLQELDLTDQWMKGLCNKSTQPLAWQRVGHLGLQQESTLLSCSTKTT